jgi:ribA/ribD-fused uncharacterized protein
MTSMVSSPIMASSGMMPLMPMRIGVVSPSVAEARATDREFKWDDDTLQWREVYKFGNCSNKLNALNPKAEGSFPFENKTYKSLMHFYYANKYNDAAIVRSIENASTVSDATKIGEDAAHASAIVRDFDNIKAGLMYTGYKAKLAADNNMKQILLGTKNALLIYEDSDKYWGSGDAKDGENRIGNILMALRVWYK